MVLFEILFALAFLVGLVWMACLARISRLLRACELGKREACPVAERMKARMSAGAAPQR